jgi:hypothetical protein
MTASTLHKISTLFSGKNIRAILFLIFTWIYSLISPVQAQYFGYSLIGSSKSVSFPFEVKNNLIVIPVILNDYIPLKFILDTGVKTSILTEKGFTDLMNVEYSRKISLAGVNITKVVEAYVASNIKFSFPGASAKNQLLLVLEEDYLRLRNTLGAEVHGLMGHDMFSRFVVEIDYVNQMITLHEPKSFKAPKRGYSRIDLEIIDSKPYIYTYVRQNNSQKIQAKLLVDTGASLSVMLERNTNPEFMIPEKSLVSNLGRGLTGDLYGHIGRINTLEILDFTFSDVIASFPVEMEYPEDMNRGDRNGILGADVLNRFNLIFNYSKGELYLKKNKDYKKPFNYNMSGMSIIADGVSLKKFVVESVRENSPADQAGLMQGDIVIKFNGKVSNNLSLSTFFSTFNKKEGKQIKMKIYRDGYVLKKKFKLRNDI